MPRPNILDIRTVEMRCSIHLTPMTIVTHPIDKSGQKCQLSSKHRKVLVQETGTFDVHGLPAIPQRLRRVYLRRAPCGQDSSHERHEIGQHHYPYDLQPGYGEL